jgi:hypothetical protein
MADYIDVSPGKNDSHGYRKGNDNPMGVATYKSEEDVRKVLPSEEDLRRVMNDD